MTQIDLEDFRDKETVRVYMAGSQEEAKRVEAVLDNEAIDYAVALEPHTTVTGLIKGKSEKYGVAFYVEAGQSEYCKKLFVTKGLGSGIND
jgi:hypothetical protein